LKWGLLAHYAVQWCAVVYTVMNIEFHKRLGMFLEPNFFLAKSNAEL